MDLDSDTDESESEAIVCDEISSPTTAAYDLLAYCQKVGQMDFVASMICGFGLQSYIKLNNVCHTSVLFIHFWPSCY